MKVLKNLTTKLEPSTASESDVKSRIGLVDVSLRDLRSEVRQMHSFVDRLQDESEDVKSRLEALTSFIEDMNYEFEDIRFWHKLILSLVMLAIILLASTFVIALVLLAAGSSGPRSRGGRRGAGLKA